MRMRLVTDNVTKQDEGGDRQLNTMNLGRYNIEDLDLGGWLKVNTSLLNANWAGFDSLTTTEMQDKINTNIEDALKEHVPLKKERGVGKKTQSSSQDHCSVQEKKESKQTTQVKGSNFLQNNYIEEEDSSN